MLRRRQRNEWFEKRVAAEMVAVFLLLPSRAGGKLGFGLQRNLTVGYWLGHAKTQAPP